ncbi:MAG TPA: SdrD B-like domain-containing protein [Candidatus Microsaccharimonas sp.]|nr:SdrD B-like domain-containing protein [Candidatus Microsaccharimonas sp.]
MKSWLRTLSNKTKTGIMVVALLAAQTAGAALPFVSNSTVHADQNCTVDTAGANDVPGQKDLTQLCVDYTNSPVSVATTWNWDDAGTQGANTMDACNLFDSNGNGFVDYATCVGTTGNPAGFGSLTTYSCSDKSVDRCTSPNSVVSSGTTSCTVAQSSDDPFSAAASNGPGDDYPNDTKASCTVQLSTVGGSSTKLIDVCSYPSGQPNSDPSDCVIAIPGEAKLTVIKSLVPSTDSGRFDLSIDGTTDASNVGDGGTTGTQIVTADKSNSTHTIAEAANSSTNATALSNYSTSVVCKDQHGQGTTLASGTPTDMSLRSLSVTVAANSDVVCTFTNTRATGTITVTKVVNSTHGGNAHVSDFPLFVSGTQVTSGTPNTYTANQSYSVTEDTNAVTGYTQTGATCVDASTQTSLGMTFTLSADQNIDCTITNSDVAPTLKLVKQVSGGSALPGDWTLTAASSKGNPTLSGTGDSFGAQTAFANDAYTLSETGGPSDYTAGAWSCDGGTLSAGTITLGLAQNVTCTITNTRDTGTLTVNKVINPSTDTGLFNLSIAGPTSYTKADQGNGGSTGAQTVDTGSYTVSETAGTNTSLLNYIAAYTCMDGNTTVASGSTNSSTTFTVAKGQNIVCTFTNTRYSSISGTKYEVNADGSHVQTPNGWKTLGGWTICIDANGDGVCGPGESTTTTDPTDGSFSFTNLVAGTYNLLETLVSGWTQIFHPITVQLAAGQNSTGNDFGNFQNGSISGYKFNDLNGLNGWDTGEPIIGGWTINLTGTTDTGVAVAMSTKTNQVTGLYRFDNLAPGTYTVCEDVNSVAGYVQTYPTTNGGCYPVTISLSNQAVTDQNFGNQGRGTITVVKNVDDGFGNVTQDVNTWRWNIDSQGGYSTGSANAQDVAAGTYTVSEVQQTGYHVTASSCGDEDEDSTPTTSLDVTVSPGEDVLCVFTNTHDTGTITVNKLLFPVTDTGKFNLLIDADVDAQAIGNGGTTGDVKVLTGTHIVSETAAPGTSLSDYNSSYTCTNGLSGTGTATTAFTIASGANVTCTFTNQHKIVPQVLGDSTAPQVLGALTNTGLPIIAYVMASLTIVGTALFVFRRQTN